jgi:hypothetical protein
MKLTVNKKQCNERMILRRLAFIRDEGVLDYQKNTEYR